MKKVLLLTAIFSILVSDLSANDTTATIVGGKITYQKSDDISIEEELLKISLTEIHVSYIFKNNSEKKIETLVAFPLPSTGTKGTDFAFPPPWDEAYYAYAFLAGNIKKPDIGSRSNIPSLARSLLRSPFVNFKRTVDGHSYGHDYSIQAFDAKGNDITDILEKNGIPLSAIYVLGLELSESPLEKDPTLKKKLQDLNLLTEKTEGSAEYPNWQTKITYFWNQTFEPGSTTKVTHSYTPQGGDHWLQGPILAKSIEGLKIIHRDLLPSGEEESKNLKDFCPSETQIKEILDLFNQDIAIKNKVPIYNSDLTYRIKEVRYILSTGGNWKGPIKKFRLEITPPTPNCLVLCCFEGKIEKDKNGIYVSEITNFNPTTELKVLFIDPLNFGETG